MSIIYALANQKGGVGKTTTAVNVGAYLAAWGQYVLVVDIDPQANATSSLGVDKRAVSPSTYDVLVRGIPLAGVVQPTARERLYLAPASPALAGARVELVNLPQREYRLRQALDGLRLSEGEGPGEPYDYVLIDCPPSLGILTVNGLTAATDGVIIPVQCEYLALEGLFSLPGPCGDVAFEAAPGEFLADQDGESRDAAPGSHLATVGRPDRFGKAVKALIVLVGHLRAPRRSARGQPLATADVIGDAHLKPAQLAPVVTCVRRAAKRGDQGSPGGLVLGIGDRQFQAVVGRL